MEIDAADTRTSPYLIPAIKQLPGEFEALGVTFIPIVNYPINWTI